MRHAINDRLGKQTDEEEEGGVKPAEGRTRHAKWTGACASGYDVIGTGNENY